MDLLNISTTTFIPLINEVPKLSFSWYDYILFATMLAISALIGLYFGCYGQKQETTNDYLLGGRKMKLFPVTISLTASHISGMTLLALPADIYRYGSAYWLMSIGMIATCSVTAWVFLPVFYKLNITTTYEYLVLRFDNKTRMFASFLFALATFTLLPVVIYIPSLALATATGFSVALIAPFVCTVCLLYTVMGGMKAIVWTDTLQFSITAVVSVIIFILGLKASGGLVKVWNNAVEGHRLDVFDFNPDPTLRDSFWIIVIGFTIQWISLTAVNQGSVQKFLSVATLKEAQMTVWIYALALTSFKTMSVLTGLIIFTLYGNCDPYSSGQIFRNDQLMPHFVMDVAGKLPGLPGLFIAGVFNGTLSSLSTNLNSLAGTLYEDFVIQWMPKNSTEKVHSNMLKLLVVILGVICTSMVFVVQNLGGILPLAIALTAIPAGPMLGLFILGVLVPRANSKGSFFGGIFALVIVAVISLTTQYYKAIGAIHHPTKPISVEGCMFAVNTTTSLLSETFASSQQEAPFILFRISYYYHALIGTCLTVLFGYLISLGTGSDSSPVNPDCVSPFVRFLLPQTKQPSGKEYTTVGNAMNVLSSNGKEGYE